MAEVVDQQQTSTNPNNSQWLGDYTDSEYRPGQTFQLSGALTVTAVEIMRRNYTAGTPTGNWTIRTETTSGGLPTGTLADANASIVVTPPAEGMTVKGSFATPFALAASTTYAIVIQCDNQATNTRWYIEGNPDNYANGESVNSANGVWSANTGFDLWFKIYVLSVEGATGILTPKGLYWGDL